MIPHDGRWYTWWTRLWKRYSRPPVVYRKIVAWEPKSVGIGSSDVEVTLECGHKQMLLVYRRSYMPCESCSRKIVQGRNNKHTKRSF